MKNVPLTREQVKALPVLKQDITDKKGRVKSVPMLSFVNEFPNNADRRMEKQPLQGNGGNRKHTNGRSSQQVSVTMKKDTAFGAVAIHTGFFKRIQHQLAHMKVGRFMAQRAERLLGGKTKLVDLKEKEKAA